MNRSLSSQKVTREQVELKYYTNAVIFPSLNNLIEYSFGIQHREGNILTARVSAEDIIC